MSPQPSLDPRQDPRIDAYIAQAEPFARPILERLRASMLAASRELREDVKWGTPHFVRRGIVAGMAGFQSHVGFGFWRSKEMQDPEGLFQGRARASMCVMKLRSVKDVPARRVLRAYVREAIALDEAFAVKGRGAERTALEARAVPPKDLERALRACPPAWKTFRGFPPGKRRDYVEWVTEARREATRTKRIEQAVAWLAEGKARHWKYERS